MTARNVCLEINLLFSVRICARGIDLKPLEIQSHEIRPPVERLIHKREERFGLESDKCLAPGDKRGEVGILFRVC